MRKEIIKLDSISKEYCVGEFTVKALQNLTFSINRGEFVAIMGSSGSVSYTHLPSPRDVEESRMPSSA